MNTRGSLWDQKEWFKCLVSLSQNIVFCRCGNGIVLNKEDIGCFFIICALIGHLYNSKISVLQPACESHSMHNVIFLHAH